MKPYLVTVRIAADTLQESVQVAANLIAFSAAGGSVVITDVKEEEYEVIEAPAVSEP